MAEYDQNDDITDAFESMVANRPPHAATGGPLAGPRVISAAEAAVIAADPQAKTGQRQLFLIVNSRIQAAARAGLKELRRPFDGLIRPAVEEVKRAVLGELVEKHGYAVEVGEDVDEAAIRWSIKIA